MDIGRLNRKVSILGQIRRKDEFGGEVIEWVEEEHVWASIEPVSGTEYFQSQQVNAETVVKITIRYNPRVNVTQRIEYGDTVYEIIGVIDHKLEHKMTVINCKELVDYGV